MIYEVITGFTISKETLKMENTKEELEIGTDKLTLWEKFEREKQIFSLKRKALVYRHRVTNKTWKQFLSGGLENI